MKFTKMHGIGNDYVYVDCTKKELKDPAEISKIVSDRHFGIGSDGLILIGSSDRADFRMNIYNADGSQAEMCGNGIRCVAKYVYDYGLTDKDEISVDTLAGINTCRNMNLKCLRCTGASVRTGQRNSFISTKSRLIKGNVDAGLHIRAFLRKILLMESAEAVAAVKATSAKSTVKAATVTGEMLICAITAETAAFAVTAVEHISEDITKNIVHVFTVKMKFLIAAIAATLESAESTGARISSCLKRGMTKLIIHFFLLWIT